MTTPTSQPPANTPPGSSPESKAVEATETRQVPLEALAASRQKVRTAEERVAELEARLAQLEPKVGAASAQAPVDVEARKALDEIRAERRQQKLAAELGLPEPKQVAVVAALLDKNADLTPTEALEIAAKRQPDMFKDRGQPGFDPSIHGSLRPTPGGAPQTEPAFDSDAWKKKVMSLPGRQKEAAINNHIGGLAAKALGLERHHKKL